MTTQEAIKILKREIDNADPIVFPEVEEALDMAIKAIEEQKVGEWITKKSNGYYPECSVCGYVFDCGAYTNEVIDETHYCPHCGARMRGGEDD